jgi:hypothetical protein
MKNRKEKKISEGGKALWQERLGGWGARSKNGECKGKKPPFPPLVGFIGRGRVLRSVRPARINCRRNILSLTGGPHHDRGGHATAHGPSSWHRNARAVAGGHIRLPTPPTTRAAAAPKNARPRRETAATTASIKWPGPLPSKEDPRAARAPGSKYSTPKGCKHRLVTSGPV